MQVPQNSNVGANSGLPIKRYNQSVPWKRCIPIPQHQDENGKTTIFLDTGSSFKIPLPPPVAFSKMHNNFRTIPSPWTFCPTCYARPPLGLFGSTVIDVSRIGISDAHQSLLQAWLDGWPRHQNENWGQSGIAVKSTAIREKRQNKILSDHTNSEGWLRAY